MKSESVIDLVGREVDGAKLQVAWKVTNVSACRLDSGAELLKVGKGSLERERVHLNPPQGGLKSVTLYLPLAYLSTPQR
jgi:hypothetical protein